MRAVSDYVEEAMAYLQFPAKKVHLNLRVSTQIRDRLVKLQRYWQELARIHSEDPKLIDLTYVSVRLLTVAVEAAWAELGGYPETEEQFRSLVASARKAAKQ